MTSTWKPTVFWYSYDGSVVPSNQIRRVDTGKWTTAMRDFVDRSSDRDRFANAVHLDQGEHYFRDGETRCRVCKLTGSELGQ